MLHFYRSLSVIILFLISSSANADVWTVYSLGNTNVIAGVMRAGAGLVADGSYKYLITFIALFSLMIMAATAAADSKNIQKMGAYIILLGALTSVFLTAKKDVYIYDPVFNQQQTVNDVPILIAGPATFFTTISHQMTTKIETYFSMPSDLTLSSGGGFNLGTSLLKASTQTQISSPFLRSTLSKFLENCVTPALASGQLTSYDILYSTDYFGAGGPMSKVSPSLWTVVYTKATPYGSVVPCNVNGYGAGVTPITVTSSSFPTVNGTDAYTYIKNYFSTAAPSWFAQGSNVSSTLQAAYVSKLGVAQNYMFGSAVSGASKSLEQAAGINIVRPLITSLAAKANVDEQSLGWGVAMAEQSQKAGWAASAVIFNDMVGYVLAVLQAFIIGVIPLIFAFSLFPGGMKIAVNYGLVLLWLSLWEPTLAIVNFIVSSFAASQLSTTVSPGYSMMDMPIVDAMSNNFILAASFLGTMTPMITYGILKGGNAFSKFIGQATGEALGGKAGDTAATGNINYGNVSARNTKMNDESLAFSSKLGFEGLTYNRMGSASIFDNSGSLQNNVLGQQIRQEISQSANDLRARAKELSTSNDQNLSSMATEALNLQKKVENSNRQTGDEKVAAGQSSSFIYQNGNLVSVSKDKNVAAENTDSKSTEQIDQASHEKSKITTVQGGASLNLGPPPGSPISGGVNIGGSYSRSIADRDIQTKAAKEAQTETWKQIQSDTNKLATDKTLTDAQKSDLLHNISLGYQSILSSGTVKSHDLKQELQDKITKTDKLAESYKTSHEYQVAAKEIGSLDVSGFANTKELETFKDQITAYRQSSAKEKDDAGRIRLSQDFIQKVKGDNKAKAEDQNGLPSETALREQDHEKPIEIGPHKFEDPKLGDFSKQDQAMYDSMVTKFAHMSAKQGKNYQEIRKVMNDAVNFLRENNNSVSQFGTMSEANQNARIHEWKNSGTEEGKRKYEGYLAFNAVRDDENFKAIAASIAPTHEKITRGGGNDALTSADSRNYEALSWAAGQASLFSNMSGQEKVAYINNRQKGAANNEDDRKFIENMDIFNELREQNNPEYQRFRESNEVMDSIPRSRNPISTKT